MSDTVNTECHDNSIVKMIDNTENESSTKPPENPEDKGKTHIMINPNDPSVKKSERNFIYAIG